MIRKPYRSHDIINLLNIMKPRLVKSNDRKQGILKPVYEINKTNYSPTKRRSI